jgi:hypothetical protein
MSFPRFGPNGAFALFNDERDVPPGWQTTAEDARRMQTLAPPPFAEMLRDGDLASVQDPYFNGGERTLVRLNEPRRNRKGRRR